MVWWWPFGNVPEIAPGQLQEKLERNADLQLIDVRTVFEYNQGHIAGARSAPIHRLPGTLEHLDLDRSRPVIAICKTAHRSVPAVRLLRREGFEAAQLAGGMDAWRSAGLPEVES